jgi:Na+/melibiose symporter-like transporter
LFRSLPFVGAIVAMFAYASSAQVMASLLPLFLQNARGESALVAGAGMLPFALAMLLLPQLGRKLAAFMESRQILALGLSVVACGNLAMMFAARGASHTWLIVAMALLGSGGGLLNGETQKGIMGTVPRERAGMASGISTTSRFTGILLGFSGLGAVLAGGVHAALVEQMSRMQLAIMPGFVEHAMAGDFSRAYTLYPAALTDTLTHIARSSYGQGFSHAFGAAAIVAAISAVIVFLSMKRKLR